ncbi:hypothetical protein B0H67DRAFT_632916 [Lasiosphaeris hirsuta]|uniref:Heterokaryon incompatibility domain-containing protein n=1 Tax=Lasiosphaeris hirsuta TaxID=260670 RepID=A0AA40E2W0_9PEZI|nr:hypothetical protein B0H67DRAFT_632916 [Lasiosphaeris hirsuta]
MRLINTLTLTLHNFLGADVPIYAILSHTWGSQEEEITFQDWLYAQRQNPPRWGWIYDEEESACQRARKDGFSWIWVDTNCIDKTSSAELSEAINSMYRWYIDGSEFRCSRWFSRGWTLQELLAPDCLVFFTNSWTRIGDKKEMAEAIHEITAIPKSTIVEPRLIRCGGIGHFNVAAMMSWASRRETILIEDMAYCLMGLFGVNMPLLYGEGDQAFLRLQLEITQKRNDPTFLVWQNISAPPKRADGIVPARLLDTFATTSGIVDAYTQRALFH